MTTLVTGGAGFIGANVVARLLSSGEPVRVLDNLSRAHVDKNLAWLREKHGLADVSIADVRDERAVREAMAGVRHVFHFAAQVAVTTSLADPVGDFDVNARGTLVVLEAARAMRPPPSLLFTSTNKVYGACSDVAFVREGNRYLPEDARLREHGVAESRPLEFHSPYGCAKGTADQYVLDWSRTYGLETCVFRMSCIYGPRQFGNEDQGWVAHFLIRAARGEPITIYGDGHQVRDVLYVDDLVDAMLTARAAMPRVAGQAFNVGGGPRNATSLLELVDRLEGLVGRRVRVRFAPWRTADQRWYVSDVRKLERLLGWRPRVGPEQGLERLLGWVSGLAPAPERPVAAAGEQAL
ncbi:MAG TPA: NAD-dependent epimerase/dehydratase family protein [Polyangiaceae bacterium]|nr:NAD-dependent epimerase/dehydratase family protein [Polyangiaceae bacterium]